MASVRLEGVSQTHLGQQPTVRDCHLEIGDEELVVLTGRTSTDASAVLRLIAGLEHPTSGRVLIDGSDVTDVLPADRGVGMVFARGALYPHLTVRKTLSLVLRLGRVPKSDARLRIDALAELLDLASLLDQRPRDLSEEERMRVALSRAIARRPEVLLLEEPLGDVDQPARRRMLDAIRGVHGDLACSVVYATRRVEEGMSLADRIAVLEDGSVEQYATPIELYSRPRNMRVAGLIGNPPMNMVEGVVKGEGDRVYFESPALTLELPSSMWSGLRTPGNGEVVLGVRPEHVRLAGRRPGGRISGSVRAVEPMGSETLVHLSGPAQTIVARLHADALPTVGDALNVGFDLDRIHLFDRRTGENLLV